LAKEIIPFLFKLVFFKDNKRSDEKDKERTEKVDNKLGLLLLLLVLKKELLYLLSSELNLKLSSNLEIEKEVRGLLDKDKYSNGIKLLLLLLLSTEEVIIFPY
jgi:hypothetical protein